MESSDKFSSDNHKRHENITITNTPTIAGISEKTMSKSMDCVRLLRGFSLVVLTLQNAVLVLVMRYARTRAGDMFLSTTAVVMAEVCKFFFCLGVIFVEQGYSVRAWVRNLRENTIEQPVDCLKICVPAVIYMVQNNLLYVALSNLDAAVFQVTYQLKILTTALFCVTMLNKQLSRLQWLSLFILFVGVAVVQLQPQDHSVRSTAGNAAVLQAQNVTLGLVTVLIACVMSGFASVYYEKLLKHTAPSIYMRNVQLGFIGIVFGMFAAIFQDGSKITEKGFFQGYDTVVWIVIALQSFGGILVAVVMKYADNILKGFATSAAIIIACAVSVFLFDVTLSLQFNIGTVLVVLSVCIYASYVPKPSITK